MPMLKNEWPEYLEASRRHLYRRVRLQDVDPVHHKVFEWAILAPGGDTIAKDADGRELRWTTGDPMEIRAIRELAIQLNRQLAEAPPAKPGKKEA